MEGGYVRKLAEDFCFVLFFTFQNDWNLFWVNKNGNFLPGKSFSHREKIRKNGFAPSEKFSCYTPECLGNGVTFLFNDQQFYDPPAKTWMKHVTQSAKRRFFSFFFVLFRFVFVFVFVLEGGGEGYVIEQNFRKICTLYPHSHFLYIFWDPLIRMKQKICDLPIRINWYAEGSRIVSYMYSRAVCWNLVACPVLKFSEFFKLISSSVFDFSHFYPLSIYKSGGSFSQQVPLVKFVKPDDLSFHFFLSPADHCPTRSPKKKKKEYMIFSKWERFKTKQKERKNKIKQNKIWIFMSNLIYICFPAWRSHQPASSMKVRTLKKST